MKKRLIGTLILGMSLCIGTRLIGMEPSRSRASAAAKGPQWGAKTERELIVRQAAVARQKLKRGTRANLEESQRQLRTQARSYKNIPEKQPVLGIDAKRAQQRKIEERERARHEEKAAEERSAAERREEEGFLFSESRWLERERNKDARLIKKENKERQQREAAQAEKRLGRWDDVLYKEPGLEEEERMEEAARKEQKMLQLQRIREREEEVNSGIIKRAEERRRAEEQRKEAVARKEREMLEQRRIELERKKRDEGRGRAEAQRIEKRFLNQANAV